MPYKKLTLLVLLSMFSLLIFTLLGWLSAMVLFDDFRSIVAQMNNYENVQTVNFLKYFQIINQIGLFVLPPILFAYLDNGNILAYFRLNNNPRYHILILSLLMVFAILPIIHWSAAINEMMSFPDWLKGMENWMRNSEQNAKEITEAFLNVSSSGAFILNILMIAVLPAIGEELFFRGVLQKLLQQWFKNVHWAVLVTAVIFSALHLQFYGFLPRTILGIMFGYLFVITKSLWVPILAHFFNNGAVVLAAFLYRKGMLGTDYHEIGQVSEPLWVIASLVIVFLLFTAIYKLRARPIEGLP